MDRPQHIRDIVQKHTAILRASGIIRRTSYQGSRHYTEEHRRAHCTCFKPEDWICEKHDKRFAECGCPVPEKDTK